MAMVRLAGIYVEGIYVVQPVGEHGLGDSPGRGLQRKASGHTGLSHDRGFVDENHVQGVIRSGSKGHSLVCGPGKEEPWRNFGARTSTAPGKFAGMAQ